MTTKPEIQINSSLKNLGSFLRMLAAAAIAMGGMYGVQKATASGSDYRVKIAVLETRADNTDKSYEEIKKSLQRIEDHLMKEK